MTVRLIEPELRKQLLQAVEKHFPDDECQVDASIGYLPDEDAGGLLPFVAMLISIDGTEQVDGLYLTQTIPVSLLAVQTVDAAVQGLAKQSRERRGEIRAALVKEQSEQPLASPDPVG